MCFIRHQKKSSEFTLKTVSVRKARKIIRHLRYEIGLEWFETRQINLSFCIFIKC